jgi:hypothetical protein
LQGQVYLAVVSVLAGVTVSGVGLAAKVWPVVRRLDDFFDDWSGAPARPGVAAKPGVMQRLADLEQGQSDRDRAQQAQQAALEQIARRLDETRPPDVPHQRAAS